MKSMKVDKKSIGFLAGLLVCFAVWLLPIEGLPQAGQRCLAMSLMAVIWWATGAMHPGFSSLAMLLGFVLFLPKDIVPNSLIFNLWTTQTIYLVIGGFLLAGAVRASGLGQRMALLMVQKTVRSFRGIIVACYVLGFLLSFFIPHPWPRSFLLMSIMAHVISASKLEKKYAVQIGLAVFVGSIPTAMILFTGDSTLNPVIGDFASTPVSWLSWLLYMGVPGILASLLTCGVQLLLFRGPKEFHLNMDEIKTLQRDMGVMGTQEKKVLAVTLFVVLLWATDSLHGIAPGWIAILAVLLLACPLVGVIDVKAWSNINLGTLFFLTAALAIGSVGAATGMNVWVVDKLLPAAPPSSPLLFALLVVGICVPLHMMLGSTLAVIGIAAPALVTFGSQMGLPGLVPAMLVYIAVALHWLLPFHHMNLLVGVGEDGGGYGNAEIFKFGLVQTLVVVMVAMFAIFWWGWVGLYPL